MASGENFPDALAASPLVYAQRIPLLFTRRGSLPQVTANALRALDIRTVFLLGGTVAVAPAVETQLKAAHQVVRVAGANRQLTAIALADLEIEDFGFSDDLVHLARGDAYPDALAGGQVAGGGGQYHPIVLSQSPTDLSDYTAAYLRRHSDELQGRVGVFGGTAAVSDLTWRAARLAADAM